MKYIYIAGLEHSGTTLTDHLLSQHPKVIGLGEIASFFSPTHMNHYMEKWGKYSDVKLCSCGTTWDKCRFWKHLVHLNGLNSNDSLVNKYRFLIDHIRNSVGEDVCIVDSSKSLNVLKTLIDNHSIINIPLENFLVIFNVKDVRSFVMSIMNKSDAVRSFSNVFRSFNLWVGKNIQFADYLENRNVNFSINLYERFCSDPDLFIGNQIENVGLTLHKRLDVSHNNSHIAMGNKNFIMRNRSKVKYDFRWYNDELINFIYLIHRKARILNKKMYLLTDETSS